MKVIDLLNKIANGEEVPKEIKFEGELCSFDIEDKDYYCEQYGNIVWYLVDTSNNMNEVLDTELEIIEEEKDIEKIPYHYNFGYIDCGDLKREVVEELSNNFNYFTDKINELVREVNKLKRENENRSKDN